MINTNYFNEEGEYCWCHDCENNSLVCGDCLNCEKCSGDNANGRYKYLNNKWKMDCKKFKGK